MMEFHISRDARERYQFNKSLFSFNGNVVFAGMGACREFAHRMNLVRDAARHPERAVYAGSLYAMGLIDEASHVLMARYREQFDPEVMTAALSWFASQVGADELDLMLLTFVEHFPGSTVMSGEETAQQWLQGSTGGVHLVKPVVGMGIDRATGGYWLVASDGGVFSFDAPFEGSTGGVHLVKSIVGIAPVSDGSGYRLVAADGGVFDFNTPFYGSTGGVHLDKPVIAGMNDNSYDGYWLVASDGGVFTFSPPGEGMPFFGSAF